MPCCAPCRGRHALKAANDDQKAGIEIVRKALRRRLRQIVDNAGDEGSVVVGKITRVAPGLRTYGYNAQTGEYGDMIKAGIIDPTKVVRTALQDAASVAGLLITTEAMIAELPKKDSGAPADAADGRRRHGRHGFLRKSRRPGPQGAGTGQARFQWRHGFLIQPPFAPAKTWEGPAQAGPFLFEAP